MKNSKLLIVYALNSPFPNLEIDFFFVIISFKVSSTVFNINIIIFFILFQNHFNQNYNFCLNCINKSKESRKCLECPSRFIFRGLNIVSKEKTLNEIIYNILQFN